MQLGSTARGTWLVGGPIWQDSQAKQMTEPKLEEERRSGNAGLVELGNPAGQSPLPGRKLM